MNKHSQKLHMYFFPMMAPGHMIPLIDMARQIARHDTETVKATIVTTPLNAAHFSATIEREREQGVDINIRFIPFPSAQVELPDHCQNLSSITSPEMSLKFTKALYLLQPPVEQLVRQDLPDCIVSDFFYPWTTDLAKKLGVPRLIFHGPGFFPLCVYHSLIKHKPYEGIVSDSEAFVVPGLPGEVKMTGLQVPDYLKVGPDNPISKIIENGTKTEEESYGIVVNSFKELEPAYVEHYRSKVGRKAWHIGPVSLCNKDIKDKAQRGNNNDKNVSREKRCLDWLSNKEPKSVVYVCFGTLSLLSDDQLQELATGLESCGQDFIWVVKDDERENEEWMPEGFDTAIEERRLIIKGWAPQVVILEHESVGGFLTHCGWNSLLEAVTAGVPMITWPISSEQFDNEKLVTEILKIGVSVGVQEWSKRTDVEKRCLVRRENISKAVKEVMAGEEGMEMRNRVATLSGEAKKAVEMGGSSYNDLNSLLEELRSIKSERKVVLETQ